MEVRLVVLEGIGKGREIPLPSTQFIIGRAEECHLRPHSTLVSKYHCVLGRSGGKVMLRDLKSRNGSFLNGQQVHGTVKVQDGDVLSIGPLQFRFAIRDAAGVPLVQAIRSDHVRWLMEPKEDFEIDANYETQVVALPADIENEDTVACETGVPEDEPKEMSAGRFLREYFQRS